MVFFGFLDVNQRFAFDEDDEIVLDRLEALGFDAIGVDALLFASGDIFQIVCRTFGEQFAVVIPGNSCPRIGIDHATKNARIGGLTIQV